MGITDGNEYPTLREPHGESIDDLDIEIISFNVDNISLTTGDEFVEETLFSNLLKSNCLVTNQPDWVKRLAINRPQSVR